METQVQRKESLLMASLLVTFPDGMRMKYERNLIGGMFGLGGSNPYKSREDMERDANKVFDWIRSNEEDQSKGLAFIESVAKECPSLSALAEFIGGN